MQSLLKCRRHLKLPLTAQDLPSLMGRLIVMECQRFELSAAFDVGCGG